MKTHTQTRERGLMLQRKYWFTVMTALVASLALLLFQPSGAAAGTIQFLEGLTEGAPATTILSADILARGAASAGSCVNAELCSATVVAPAGTTAVTFGGNVNIFGIESFNPNVRALSDTINFVVLSSTLGVAHFNFTSDSETGPPLTLAGVFQGISPIEVDENGGIQTGTTITWTTPSGPVVDTISFRSDFETPPGTPEPATLLLLGTGLVGAALWGKRRLGKHVND